MKSIKQSAVWILSSIIVAISFSSCSNDLDAIEQSPDKNVSMTSVYDVRVVASGRDQGDRSLIFYFERGRDSGVKATSVFSSG